MKNSTLLFVSLIYGCFTSHLHGYDLVNRQQYAHYQQQAVAWLHTYIIDSEGTQRASNNDLQLIANIVYFSYYRSKMTLDAQETALQTLENIWQGWQNIAQTRRNPSVDLPYSITHQQKQQSLEQFWPIQHKHRAIGLTYAHATEALIKDNVLESPLSFSGVQEMRKTARTVIMENMADAQQYLNILFGNTQKRVHDTLDQWQAQKRNTIFDRIWSYVSQLSISSFTEADKLYNTISQEGWQTFKTTQEASKHMWRIVEEARAAFYLAYYKTLYATLQQLNLDQSYMTIIFGPNGLIRAEDRRELLPDPHQLY